MIFLNRKKSFLSILLVGALGFSIVPSVEAVSISQVDIETEKVLYETRDGERIIDTAIIYPALAIITESDGDYYLRVSNDYGKTWTVSDFDKYCEGFIPEGIYDPMIPTLSTKIYGSCDGKLTFLSTGSFDYPSKEPYPYSNIEGNIVDMFEGDGVHTIYFERDDKIYTATASSWGEIETVNEFNYRFDNLLLGTEFFLAYDSNSMYTSVDAIEWYEIPYSNIFKNPDSTEILYCSPDDTVCNESKYFIIYKDGESVKCAGLSAEMHEDDISTSKVELLEIDSEKDYLQVFEKYGYDVNLSGQWGYDMLISNDKIASMIRLDKDAQSSPCEKSNVYWIDFISSPSDWAYSTVYDAAKVGIVTPRTLPENGYNTPITRERFCEYVYNMIASNYYKDIPINKSFSDTSSKEILYLASAGIINGVGDGKFAPNDYITREQAAIIMKNLSKFTGIKEDIPNTSFVFNDLRNVSDWALDSVEYVKDMGIFNGDSLGNFNPKSNISSEESIATIFRVYKIRAGGGSAVDTCETCNTCQTGLC